ncbi:hypothetical protein KDA_24190 [Dictyobacter alpinus]|uniref:Type II secretion system protein GspE N-terminal domain-containing protein n=1 Tax=Dictyobacter alpinus TaxID=2014873 RepID=A0A402B6G4_9CHLR|nr:hypothetical protein [Dictyobacter alpinus]GCE26935.1 hypothetical protein KDA_24190 [Dictyobacter alpinus]
MGSRTRQQKEVSALQAAQIAQFSASLARHLIVAPGSCEPCRCNVFEPAGTEDAVEQATEWDDGQRVPISQDLDRRVSELLNEILPMQKSVSMLLLHLVQRESHQLTSQSVSSYQRKRYHAPTKVLDQVLTNVRRVLRLDDKMFIFDASGVAIIFVDVDQVGIQKIAERVFDSICLLQAETIIPPLKRETTIALGIATYPRPAASYEQFAQQAGQAVHHLTLRPAITTQLHGVKPIPTISFSPLFRDNQESDPQVARTPFMELPRILPGRLKQLIPYHIACELKCVPVGYEQHCLTVAMQEPTNSHAIARLHMLTGYTIFPVACEESKLHTLLVNSW